MKDLYGNDDDVAGYRLIFFGLAEFSFHLGFFFGGAVQEIAYEEGEEGEGEEMWEVF